MTTTPTRSSFHHTHVPRNAFRLVHPLRSASGADRGRLLVGVDGTPESEALLEWAALTGERLDLSVVAVTTARDHSFRFREVGGGAHAGPGDRRPRIVASVRGRHPDADLGHLSVRGVLAAGLCRLAREGDLIVAADAAGSAERSGNSVDYYLRYARCAVVIPPYEILRDLQAGSGSGSVPPAEAGGAVGTSEPRHRHWLG